jgi:uncharacterized protein (TIGR02246 family)
MQNHPARSADEAAVRNVVRTYVQARETGDPAKVAALFTPDADQLTSSGEWRVGRDQVVSGSLASSQRTTGTREIVVERVRFPAAGLAIVDGRYTIRGAQGGDRRMWTTFVMTSAPDGWRISAIRNMLPAPAAQ